MYGLLGKKLSHSFSKSIHEEFTSKKYELIETDNLNQFFHSANIEGINVTIPYKQEVIPYLSKLSPEASEIGAVNTIISRNGQLLGYNTDYYGFKKTLDFYDIEVKGKVVLILGNGSTSRTLSTYCIRNQAKKVIILARNPNKDEYYFNDIDMYKSCEIVFNATPVGMFPNTNQELLINLNDLPNVTSVVDVIYNPLRTSLLIEAEKLGLIVVNGLLMLIYQAIKSIELFHNITINDKEVINYYHKLVNEKSNYVFIGMPMSGKSFYSKLMANRHSKTLVEIDSEIELEEGIPISQIFDLKGESYFRNLESSIINKYSKLNNQAISCGGGVILDSKNMDMLKQNGIIIFIDMPLDMLKRCNPKDRPLLKDKKNIDVLYNTRYSLYKHYADVIINKTTFNEKELTRQIEVKLNEYISTKWS